MNSGSKNTRRRDGGMILLTVLFIMVFLGLFAAFLARSLGGQHAQATLVQLSQQAQFAAASGIEWGRNRALQAGICGTNQIAVYGFAVTVTCSSAAIVEGAAAYTVFEIQAEARRGNYGNADFVRRSLQARVTNR